jgi:parvulin-like peptidyl-prolyl isomerase
MRKRDFVICLFLLAATLALSACGSGKPEREIVGTVNKAPIYKADLQKEIVRYTRQNPQLTVDSGIVEERLNTLIEKKLMIQEAVKKGLTKDERFVETIKTFWEQTLIRELLAAKNREWADRLFVTEAEVRKEYERMLFRPRLAVVKADTKQAADEIAKEIQGGKHPAGEETVGPLLYEDVKGSPLANAFDMKPGEVKAFAADGKFVVIRVTDREAVQMPPLKEASRRIQESILAQKKEQVLTEWIEAVRKSAKIDIDSGKVKDAAHE